MDAVNTFIPLIDAAIQSYKDEALPVICIPKFKLYENNPCKGIEDCHACIFQSPEKLEKAREQLLHVQKIQQIHKLIERK
ncbi:MAG: hypothetical protein ACRBB6_04345 [Neptuniibacter sp.]